MGVSSFISRRVRVLGVLEWPAIDFLEADVVAIEESSAVSSLVREGRVLSRSCCMSLRESERPVPSYPLMVDAMNTRYGPRRLRTRGRGIAAASSMMTSSACPKTWASSGWMYYKNVRVRQH